MSLESARPVETFRPRRRYLGKTIAALLALFFLLALVVGFILWRSAYAAKDSSATVQAITIESGTGTEDIARLLTEQGLVSSERVFKIAVVLTGSRGKLQAGIYELSAAMSPAKIAGILVTGATKERRVTIPEGLRLDEVAQLLEKNSIVSAKEFVEATQENFDFAFLKSKPAVADLEGFLFPDTYTFRDGVSAHDVVGTMLSNFDQRISALLPQIEASKRSLFEIVTLASIVEGEVPSDEDRKVVAGVFFNRLAEDMLLQADSTLAYILKQDRIDFSTEDTKIDSPYNTYKSLGLPPGPINSPGLSSLRAVLAPADTEFFYFVSDPDTGETVFAKTLDEHNANVKRVLGD